jgi:phage-related holin
MNMSATGIGGTLFFNKYFMSILYIPVMAFFAYFDMSWESLSILALLLTIDYFTGIAKVYMIDKSEIKSYKAIAGIISKVTVLIIPIALYIAAKKIDFDLHSYVDAIITMLVLAETYSIIGNVRSIQLRENIQEIDAVSFVLKKLTHVIENLLKRSSK